MIKFPDFLEELVDAGISITMAKDTNMGVYFDLNLQAKSHMHLFTRDDAWFVAMRYDEEFEVEDVADLKRCARHGMHGRDFVNSAWAELLMSDEERIERDLARSALNKLSGPERAAINKFLGGAK